MILIEITGVPVPWSAHGGYGRRSFNPRFRERDFYRWQIKAQYNQLNPLEGPVRASYYFHHPIPKGTSKARRLQMLNGLMHPIKRPDMDNYNKFLSDCLNGILWIDDSQVVDLYSKKLYGEVPKTIVKIEALNG